MKRFAVIALALLMIGATADPEQLPKWLYGPYRSEDKRIKLHFLDGGQLWATFDGKYETIRWKVAGDRYYVCRLKEDTVQAIGFVTRSTKQWHVVWHPLKSDLPEAELKQFTRGDPP